MKDSDIRRDSLIEGDRHVVRLTHVPTKISIEVEGRIPKDRKHEAEERKKTRDKAWELLDRKIKLAIIL